MIQNFKDKRGSLTVASVTGNAYDQILVSTNEKKFTFRGMHYQETPKQSKIIKVIQGKIVDFVYDLESERVDVYELTPDDGYIVVEEDEAHGYLTLEPNTVVLYLVNGKWNPETEHSIPYTKIGVLEYRIGKYTNGEKIIISEKDKIGK